MLTLSAKLRSGSHTNATPPGHPGAEVAARRAEHDHAPAGHVLAPVVADPSTTAVAPELRTQKRSPACPDEYLAGGRAVEDDVAGDDLLLRREGRVSGGRTVTRPPDRPLAR